MEMLRQQQELHRIRKVMLQRQERNCIRSRRFSFPLGEE